jgi:hypothetical protein
MVRVRDNWDESRIRAGFVPNFVCFTEERRSLTDGDRDKLRRHQISHHGLSG